jgi:hypothetical protein
MDIEINSIFPTLIPLISALFGALTGSYLTYHFAIKQKRAESILKFKEEKYSKLLILLQGFVGNTSNKDTKMKFFEEQYQSWLYCSDDVTKSINDLIRLVINNKGKTPNPEDGLKAIGNIVLTMRKDLLGKTKLKYDDFKYTDVVE